MARVGVGVRARARVKVGAGSGKRRASPKSMSTRRPGRYRGDVGEI